MLKPFFTSLFVWLMSALAGADAAEPIRIGVTLGLTGTYAGPAKMMERGYGLWEQDINRRGGILGRPVKIVIRDDKSDKEEAKKIYLDLISRQRVHLLFGPYSSAITVAVAPILERFGYPTLLPGAAADSIWEQGYKNVFGLYIPASRYALEMFNLAVLHNADAEAWRHAGGLRRVAIAYADDEFSTAAGRGAKKWAGRLKLDVVMSEEFPKGTRDLLHLALEARDVSADLLVVAGHFNESIDMRRALIQIGWYPRAYFATVGPTLQAYHDTLGQDAELTFAPSIWEPDESVTYPGSQQFIRDFRRAHSELPSYHAADAFAAGQVLEAAIKKAEGLDHDKIRRVLYDLDVYTVIGRYRVDKLGVPIKHRPLVIQWLGGKKVIVYPEEHRGDARPVFRSGG